MAETAPERPEFERLMKRLGVDEGRLIDFHVSWGPDAHKLTAEERAGVLNKTLDQAEAQNADRVSISRVEMTEIRNALIELLQIGRAEATEWMKMPEEMAALRRRVGAVAEFPAIFARQALERENAVPRPDLSTSQWKPRDNH